MKLTEDQEAKIQSHFVAKPGHGGFKCSVCNNTDWNILDRIYELREFNKAELTIGGTLIPLISLICTNCGNTIFFNAYQLGIIKKEERILKLKTDESEQK